MIWEPSFLKSLWLETALGLLSCGLLLRVPHHRASGKSREGEQSGKYSLLYSDIGSVIHSLLLILFVRGKYVSRFMPSSRIGNYAGHKCQDGEVTDYHL